MIQCFESDASTALGTHPRADAQRSIPLPAYQKFMLVVDDRMRYCDTYADHFEFFVAIILPGGRFLYHVVYYSLRSARIGIMTRQQTDLAQH
jgi:hypothetical protein